MLQQLKMAVDTRVLRQSHAERLISELEKGQWPKFTPTTFAQGSPQTREVHKYMFLGGDSTLVLGGKTSTANNRLAMWIPSAVREYCEVTFPCIRSGFYSYRCSSRTSSKYSRSTSQRSKRNPDYCCLILVRKRSLRGQQLNCSPMLKKLQNT